MSQGELPDERPLEDRVVTGAHDQLDAVLKQYACHGQVAPLTIGEVGEPKHLTSDAGLRGDLERRAITIRADDHDSRGIERVLRRLDQRLQVAAPA